MLKMEDIKSVVKSGNNFKISWKMTDWCNYRCKYCYMSSAVSKGDNNTPFEKILEIASHIDDIINVQAKGRKVVLHLIGGEVGYYDLVKVIDSIKSPLLKCVIIATNFSNKLEYWENLDNYCKSRGICLNIIASFHLDYCNRDEFVEKAIKLGASVKCVINNDNLAIYKPYFEKILPYGNRIECTVERDSINKSEQLTPENYEYVNNLNKRLKKRGIYFYVTLNDDTVVEYPTNISFINDIEGGMYLPHNFYCTAGLDGIRINQKGDLLRAACTWCSSKFGPGKLGNICDKYILPTDPIVCNCLKIPTEKIDENGHKTGEADYENTRKKGCTCFCNSSMFREYNK